jgi:Zn-dependent peptidase ImmA (M78 family)
VKTYNKAEKILLDLGITSPIDINLDIIAWSQGVKVNRRTLENCEAWIIGDTEEAIISVNSNTATSRQRFSIAHELGHWQNDRGASLFAQHGQ